MNGLATSTQAASVALFPLGYKPNNTRRGVVYAHSLGGTYLSAFDSTVARDPLSTFAADGGMPTLCTTLGGTSTWGNDASQTAMSADFTELTTTHGAKTDKVFLYAASMGGLPSLRWTLANPAKVAGVALVCPCVDLAYEHDQDVFGYGAIIETAHGITGTYAGNATITARDPMQQTAAMAATGVPIKMWYASNDVQTVTARQQAYITATGCQSSSLGAVGHTITNVPWGEVVQFFQSVG